MKRICGAIGSEIFYLGHNFQFQANSFVIMNYKISFGIQNEADEITLKTRQQKFLDSSSSNFIEIARSIISKAFLRYKNMRTTIQPLSTDLVTFSIKLMILWSDPF